MQTSPPPEFLENPIAWRRKLSRSAASTKRLPLNCGKVPSRPHSCASFLRHASRGAFSILRKNRSPCFFHLFTRRCAVFWRCRWNPTITLMAGWWSPKNRLPRRLAKKTSACFGHWLRKPSPATKATNVFAPFSEHAKDLELEVEERKRAEHRFRMLLETSPIGIVISDGTGRIEDVNAEALRLFGYEREELVGQMIEILVPQRLQRAHAGHRSLYARDPRTRSMGAGMELFARRKDGTEFPIEVGLGPLATKEGVLVSSTIVDITALRKMEEQLRLSQRMDAIGRLAGGVAHDFNNLLTVILGNSDVVLDSLPPGHPAIQKLEIIRKSGLSPADLIRMRLVYGRLPMVQPRILDLKDTLQKMEVLLRRLIGAKIELKISLDSSLGAIKADPGQIAQILLILPLYSPDSMPTGWDLTIEACNVEIDERYREQHPAAIPGRYVLLAITDTGCGMDRETQLRIFDPFFTTKELGKGTGLGLATVYGIVKQ